MKKSKFHQFFTSQAFLPFALFIIFFLCGIFFLHSSYVHDVSGGEMSFTEMTRELASGVLISLLAVGLSALIYFYRDGLREIDSNMNSLEMKNNLTQIMTEMKELEKSNRVLERQLQDLKKLVATQNNIKQNGSVLDKLMAKFQEIFSS